MNSIELKVEMLRNNVSITEMAHGLCKSKSAVSKQINGINEFTRKDIVLIKEILNLTPERVDEIFFTNEVDLNSTNDVI